MIAQEKIEEAVRRLFSTIEFTAAGEKRYTDIDTELFGFKTQEILLIRAAFSVLSMLMPVPVRCHSA